MSPERGPHVAPLEGRLRHLQNWDAAPKGFELISADKAKLLGIFPPPGNVAKLTSFVPPVLDPALASMVAMLSGGDADSAITALLPSSGGSKSHRRLYVAGFPAEATEDEIARFLSKTIASVGSSSADAVLGVQISHDRNYAFVDFRTPEDATTLVGFDGLHWKDGVSSIRIRRPREYNESGETTGTVSAGVLSSISLFMAETDKIALVGLPKALREEHVRAMLDCFGELRSCVLLCEPSGVSTGIAVFEYRDEHLGQRVCDELNGLMMGQATALSLRPVTEVAEDEPELLRILSCFNLAISVASGEPTSVLQLLNMVAEDGPDLQDDYDELRQDILQEASKYGTVQTLEIPRPSGDGTLQPGVGKVFVEFASEHEAQAALEALSGRLFADRTVVGFYYPPSRFHAHLY
jgi:splicing factor U2AF subunit